MQMTKVESPVELECSVERVDPVHVRLEVTVPALRVQAAVEKAFARIARTARVPGFRPGRVPRGILEKQFWPVVRAEVEKELVAESFGEVVNTHQLRLTGEFHLEQVSLRSQEPLTYAAVVEVWPDIERVQYAGLQVEVPSLVVTEEQVKAVLTDLLDRHTKLVPIVERDVVAVGDVVELSVLTTPAGQAPKDGKRRELVWLNDLKPDSPLMVLVGRKIGELVEIKQNPAADEASFRAEAPSATWEARIERLFTRDVPALDVDFVRTVSSTAETVEELEAQIRRELEVRAERRRAALIRGGLRKALVEANPGLVVPPSFLHREEEELARNYTASLGLPVERAGEFVKRNPSLAQHLREEAYVRTASEILIAELARQEGIEVDDSELDEWLARSSAEAGHDLEQIRARYAKAEARERLRQELVWERAFELVQQKATIRERTDDSQIAEALRNG